MHDGTRSHPGGPVIPRRDFTGVLSGSSAFSLKTRPEFVYFYPAFVTSFLCDLLSVPGDRAHDPAVRSALFMTMGTFAPEDAWRMKGQ